MHHRGANEVREPAGRYELVGALSSALSLTPSRYTAAIVPIDAPIVAVRGLRFTYPGGEAPVLDGLDFEIGEGEIFGFLGPNGSGKTTTQKLLARILFGYEGQVSVFGGDLRSFGRSYFNRVGVCFENPNLYLKLTAEENLNFYRSFFDVPTDGAGEMLERLDLPVGDKRRAGQFSKGMQLRLALGRSLLNRPALLFLDEPTAGQDPQHAVGIRDLLREMAANGTTLFLTTHNMTLAAELCDRVALLSEGEIVAVDTPRALVRAGARRIARVEYRANGQIAAGEFRLDDSGEKTQLLQIIEHHAIESIHTDEPTLEDVFIQKTGRRLI